MDDGTETTRTIFFAKQLENLIKKDKVEILTYKENPSDFEQIKTDLLGKTIKVVGRIRKNEMFSRLEIISQLVFPDIDPDEEIKKLAEEQKTDDSQQESTTPQENIQEPTKETTSEQSNNPDNAI